MGRNQNDIQRRQRAQGTGFSKAGSNPIQNSMEQFKPLPNQKAPLKSWLSNFTPKIEVAPTVSGQVLAANDKRNYLMLQNNSDTRITVGYGVQATAGSYAIEAGGFIEFNVIVPMNAINILCAAPDKQLVIIEGIKV